MKTYTCDACRAPQAKVGLRPLHAGPFEVGDITTELHFCDAACVREWLDVNRPATRPDFDAEKAKVRRVVTARELMRAEEQLAYDRSLEDAEPPIEEFEGEPTVFTAPVIVRRNHAFAAADVVRSQREAL